MNNRNQDAVAASGELQPITISTAGLIDPPQVLQINGFAQVQDPVEGSKLVLAAMATRELAAVASVTALTAGVAAE